MRSSSRLIPSSLRSKIGLAASAGLMTTTILTALLLFTAFNSGDVVSTARNAHDRVRIFGQLLGAAQDYQRAGYFSAREPGDASNQSFRDSERRFAQVIDEASRLPVSNLHEREVISRVASQSRAVLDHFRHSKEHVARVSHVWRTQGGRAALLEVDRLLVPIKQLEETLDREISRGDIEVATAVDRAQMLSRVAVTAAIICLLLAVGFLLLLHRLLHNRLRPGLARLEEGALAFGAGDLDHRIALDGEDELSNLSFAFDSMAQTIADKQEALRRIQLDLERVVAERTLELQKANSELSAVDERRRAFLADVSHELRTPLTIIRGETQVALRTFDDPAFDPHEVFEHILDQTQDLSRMVNDLFLIARAEAGGLPLDRRHLDLGEVASKVAADFETLALENGGSIRANTQDCVFAHADPERLRRALAALIENAMRHCQSGVNIVIEVMEEDGNSIIAVCDDGPGVNPHQVEQLFERFRRGETRGEGSGLGLSIVSALLEAHGGRAYLEAMPESGTRAVMVLPRSLPEQVAA